MNHQTTPLVKSIVGAIIFVGLLGMWAMVKSALSENEATPPASATKPATDDFPGAPLLTVRQGIGDDVTDTIVANSARIRIVAKMIDAPGIVRFYPAERQYSLGTQEKVEVTIDSKSAYLGFTTQGRWIVWFYDAD